MEKLYRSTNVTDHHYTQFCAFIEVIGHFKQYVFNVSFQLIIIVVSSLTNMQQVTIVNMQTKYH